MTNSRRKGKDGELELARILRGYGYETRRGQQYSGANGDADVVGLPGIHIEVKRYKTISPGDLDHFMEQAIRDAQPGEIPAVFYREDRKPWRVYTQLADLVYLSVASPWVVFIPDTRIPKADQTLDDFMEVYKAWRTLKEDQQT